MAVLSIRTVGDPILRTRARAPRGLTPYPEARIRRLVADMYQTMDAAGGIGLAANQVGADLRLFTYDAAGHRGDVVDPQLELLTEPGPVPRDPQGGPASGTNLLQEGCLSVASIYGPVARALRVRLTGTTAEGEPVDITAEGLLAACFQHEVDHLDGTLFIDRLTGEDRREAMRTLRAREYRSSQHRMQEQRTEAAGGSGSSFFAS